MIRAMAVIERLTDSISSKDSDEQSLKNHPSKYTREKKFTSKPKKKEFSQRGEFKRQDTKT